MARVMKKRSRKAGLPPGTLIHIGEQRAESSAITVMSYQDNRFHEAHLKTVEECFPYQDDPSVSWINIDGIHQIDILEKLGGHFNFHPLVMEDVMNTDQRAKMEDYTDYLYIVIKMISYNGGDRKISTKQISLIVTPHIIFSFQEGDSVR